MSDVMERLKSLASVSWDSESFSTQDAREILAALEGRQVTVDTSAMEAQARAYNEKIARLEAEVQDLKTERETCRGWIDAIKIEVDRLVLEVAEANRTHHALCMCNECTPEVKR